jgi:hypothetical protein
MAYQAYPVDPSLDLASHAASEEPRCVALSKETLPLVQPICTGSSSHRRSEKGDGDWEVSIESERDVKHCNKIWAAVICSVIAVNP